MKNIIVRLVVIFMTVFMTANGATIIWLTGPGFVSGGNTYQFQTPMPGLTFFTQVSGSTGNNFKMSFDGVGGASLSIRTATSGNPWIVGHTYSSTDGLGGNVVLSLNTPVSRASTGQMSSWEFTVLEAVMWGNSPDVFAFNGVITDLSGEKTWFAGRYGSTISLPVIPEPTTPLLVSLLSFTFTFRRRR